MSLASFSSFVTDTFGSTIVVFTLGLRRCGVPSLSFQSKVAVLVSVSFGDVRRLAATSATGADIVNTNVSSPDPAALVYAPGKLTVKKPVIGSTALDQPMPLGRGPPFSVAPELVISPCRGPSVSEKSPS